MNIQEIRKKYPQYSDLSDEQLAKGLHQKFYADLPFDTFAQRIGFGVKAAEPSAQIVSPEEMLTPITESPEVQALREKTKEYEAGTNILERAGRDLERGGLRALNILPALTAASRQKEIEKIRRGEVGRTDPMTGEFIPLTPEEEEAAIATLQGAQREELESVAKREAQARAIPGRPVTAAVGQAKTFGEAIQAAGVDPLGAMAGFALESLPQMAPALAIGAATRQPLAGAAAMGGSSMASELGNSVFEYLSEQGVDVNDTNAVMVALDDPKVFREAYDFAMKRAAIIGTIDAATAGLASKALVPKKLIGSPKAREAVNIAIAQPVAQMASGAGGEAAAQLATYGEVRKPGEVIAEALGEGPTSVAETAAFGGRRIYEELRKQEAAAEAPVAPTERVEPTFEPEVVAEKRIEPTVEPEVRAEEPTPEAEEPIVPAFDEEEVDIVTEAKPQAPVSAETQEQIDALQKQYARIDQQRMDPMLTPESPEFAEFDARQAEIRRQIEELRSAESAPPEAPAAPAVAKPEKAEPTVDLNRYSEIMEKRNEGKTLAQIQQETPDLDVINTVSQGLAAENPRKSKAVRDRESQEVLRMMLMEDNAPKTIPTIDKDVERLAKFRQLDRLYKERTQAPNKIVEKQVQRQIDDLQKSLSKEPMGRFVPEARFSQDIQAILRAAPEKFNEMFGDNSFTVQKLIRNFDTKEDVRKWYNSAVQTKLIKYRQDRNKYGQPYNDVPYTLNYLFQQFDAMKAAKPAEAKAPVSGKDAIERNQEALSRNEFIPDDENLPWSDSTGPAKTGDLRRYLIDTPDGKVQVNLDFTTSPGYKSAVYGLATSDTGFRSLVSTMPTSVTPKGSQDLDKIKKDPYKYAQEIVDTLYAEKKKQDAKVARQQKRAAPKPTKEEQAELNRQRQAEKKAATEAKKEAKAPKPKPAEKVEEVVEEEEVAAPAAEVEKVEVTRQYSDDDIAEQLKRFEVGNFTVPKAAAASAEARETAEEMNRRYTDIYKEATRVFLEGPITAKPGKLELTEGLTGIAPRPIVKKIVPKFKTFDDQVKALEPSAAKKDIRYYLNGIFLNKTKNEMVVTDGHRMAVWKAPVFEGMPKAEGDQIMSFDREFIDGKYPDYTRVIPEHDKNKTRVEAEPLGNYARGVTKAAKFISKDPFSAMRIKFGPQSIQVNAKYIVDMTDMFRRFGYDTFDMSIGIDPKTPTLGSKIYATSPDGKLVQVVMPITDKYEPKFASYSIPGVKETKEVKDEIDTAENQRKEAQAKREADIQAEREEVDKRVESAKQTGRFADFIDNWVSGDNVDNAIRDLVTKNFDYEGRFEPRAELIEQMVEDGYTLTRDRFGGRGLSKGSSVYVEDLLSETGADYAQYLLAKKAPAQENLMVNTLQMLSKIRAAAAVDREETIKTYANVRAKARRAIKEVAKYGSDIPMQRQLNKLLGYEQELKDYLDSTAPVRNTAQDFLAKASKELADGNISEEVFFFINDVYRKQPSLLEGLRLSVRSKKAPDRSAGNFNPFERIVTLWKDGSGVDDPKTIRHELTHSLEQMMLPAAQKAVADAWARAFEKAAKQNIDKPAKAYFDAVIEFLERPSDDTYKAAISAMPSYDFYQYLNPSEFWAVNAEKLMGSEMGSGWARFKKSAQKLLEFIKSVFGFENNYVVHREFDNIIKGSQERVTKKTISQLIEYGGYKPTFLENIEDVDNLLDKHNRPDAPLHPSDSVKDRLMNTYRNGKKIRDRIEDEGLVGLGKGVITGADRAITYARNKNVWYGSGLDQADFARYNGQLRDSQGKAVASIAVTNAIHAGHVGTQVMVQGKLEYNPKSQQFMAKKSDKSMANVLKEKAKLVDKLGAQRAANVIQAYFEAKRSRSIVNEFLEREQRYQEAIEAGIDPEEAANDLANIERAMSKVNMDDEQIDDFIGLENDYPELRTMMDNWTAVNQNQLDMSYFAGNLSKKRYEQLKSIKDYVPWQRIMDDQKDPHDFPTGGTTRTMTNVGKEKRFKAGEVDLDIDDIVDNMIHNVMWMTKNTMRNYAANRVADEYGIRNEKGKLKVFPKEGTDSQGVKFNILRNGRRIVVGIEDPLIAESVLGMENVEIPMNKILALMANGLRRSITLSGAFQVIQLFMDAPTAAWVSGVKNPFAVWANTFIAFGKVLVDKDPIAQQLRQAGIGGFMSTARTPEKELALEIGLLNKSMYARVLRVLDHIGDASDYAQRVAVYKQVLKETGDEAQALLQANNVIDFLKRGSGQTAQFLGRTVAFMNAYAQQMDVLATAIAGGGLKGMKRKKAFAQFVKTGLLLSSVSLLYCFVVGDDEEYEKLDDQTKLRNFVIPGSKKYFGETVILPMHTSASFFFKAIPELLYNTYVREGAKDEMDSRRFRRGLKEAALDAMLGPNVVPTGAKPFIEIGLNKNFWSGTDIIPKGMKDLAAAEQYTAATSELGKLFSALSSIPFTDDKRILAPVEADHLMRGLFGSAAAMAMWGSNLLAGDRAESRVKDIPVIGAFVLPPVPRGREDLFYDLKDVTDEKYKTYMSLLDREKYEEADKYLEKNFGLITLYDYTSQMDTALKEINKEIRRIGTTSAQDMSPKERRQQMDQYGELKNDILTGVESFRKQAFD